MDTSQRMKDAQEVRRQVFQVEQAIPAEIDIDGRDEEALHFVLYEDEKPVAGARARFVDESKKVAKIERVAVLKEYRGKDLGKRVMDEAEKCLREAGVEKVYLNSQSYIKGFYLTLGYVQEGDEFSEANIPHVKMVKSLV